MKDHGFICKINKRLWETESQWPQPSAEASNKNECLHLDALTPFPANANVRSQQFDNLYYEMQLKNILLRKKSKSSIDIEIRGEIHKQ